ncbi:hypothetical protein KIPB_015589, partial [Kipferlia bialata]|eukprot:g15589.t1
MTRCVWVTLVLFLGWAWALLGPDSNPRSTTRTGEDESLKEPGHIQSLSGVEYVFSDVAGTFSNKGYSRS